MMRSRPRESPVERRCFCSVELTLERDHQVPEAERFMRDAVAGARPLPGLLESQEGVKCFMEAVT